MVEPSPKLWYTHINRNVIDGNRKHGKSDPPIKFQHGKNGTPTYCQALRLADGSSLVYSANGHLLPCGARLVIVSKEAPTVIE